MLPDPVEEPPKRPATPAWHHGPCNAFQWTWHDASVFSALPQRSGEEPGIAAPAGVIPPLARIREIWYQHEVGPLTDVRINATGLHASAKEEIYGSRTRDAMVDFLDSLGHPGPGSGVEDWYEGSTEPRRQGARWSYHLELSRSLIDGLVARLAEDGPVVDRMEGGSLTTGDWDIYWGHAFAGNDDGAVVVRANEGGLVEAYVRNVRDEGVAGEAVSDWLAERDLRPLPDGVAGRYRYCHIG